MLKENHFDDNFIGKPRKKLILKSPEDTQLDLYADFERLANENAKITPNEGKNDELAQAAELSAGNEPPSKEKLAEMLIDSEKRWEEAKKYEAGWRTRRNAEKLAKISGKSFAEIARDGQAREKAERVEKARIKKENEEKIKNFEEDLKKKIHLLDNNPDDINEDGSVKPFEAGEEYYGRYKKRF